VKNTATMSQCARGGTITGEILFTNSFSKRDLLLTPALRRFPSSARFVPTGVGAE